jgi:flavin-binding protein dodecin
MMAIVDNNKVTQYRVNLKVTFEVATNRPKGGKKAR